MPRDLEGLLHATAERPAAGPDMAGILRRGRRRRRVRRAAAATGTVACLALAAIGVAGLGEPAGQVVRFGDNPPAAQERAPDAGDGEQATPSPEEQATEPSSDRGAEPADEDPPGASLEERLEGPPSQTPEDAARDGVVPELAALPLDLRAVRGARGPSRVRAEEGLWIIARPDRDVMELTHGCGLGDPDGLYGRDIICVPEYGEILLLDDSATRVERAYPLPGVPPQWLVVADDAVYCGRQGDGGLPTSMLCRIDRSTGELTVRLFTHDLGTGHGPITDYLGEFIAAAGWVVDDSQPGVRFNEPDLTDGGLVVSGHDGDALVDPDTLEVAPIPSGP